MTADAQLALDLGGKVQEAHDSREVENSHFAAPDEGVSLILTPSRRGACGICDVCHGHTWGKSVAVTIDGVVNLVCGTCDRRLR